MQIFDSANTDPPLSHAHAQLGAAHHMSYRSYPTGSASLTLGTLYVLSAVSRSLTVTVCNLIRSVLAGPTMMYTVHRCASCTLALHLTEPKRQQYSSSPGIRVTRYIYYNGRLSLARYTS